MDNRILDYKRWGFYIGGGRDFNNDAWIGQARVVIKWGDSYEEKLIEEQNDTIRGLKKELETLANK